MDERKKPTTRRRGGKSRRGLTLIEILVVVTILGLIAGIVGITVANQLEEAKIDTANVQMKNVGDALELYKIKFNRYPNTAEGLQALVKPPEGKKPLMETVPKDPWDAEYIFVSPGQHNPSKFDLQSKGPDGIADSEDDIKNW
jgi:general secretion pathway protein G